MISWVENVWALPASFTPSLLLTGLLCLRLSKRASLPAALWAIAFLAGNLVEAASKSTLGRPALWADTVSGPVHLSGGFDHSFPSGHTIRSILLASLAGYLWPRARPHLLVWVIGTLALLELAGSHTPSDLLGGTLLASALLTGVMGITQARAADQR